MEPITSEPERNVKRRAEVETLEALEEDLAGIEAELARVDADRSAPTEG